MSDNSETPIENKEAPPRKRGGFIKGASGNPGSGPNKGLRQILIAELDHGTIRNEDFLEAIEILGKLETNIVQKNSLRLLRKAVHPDNRWVKGEHLLKAAQLIQLLTTDGTETESEGSNHDQGMNLGAVAYCKKHGIPLPTKPGEAIKFPKALTRTDRPAPEPESQPEIAESANSFDMAEFARGVKAKADAVAAAKEAKKADKEPPPEKLTEHEEALDKYMRAFWHKGLRESETEHLQLNQPEAQTAAGPAPVWTVNQEQRNYLTFIKTRVVTFAETGRGQKDALVGTVRVQSAAGVQSFTKVRKSDFEKWAESNFKTDLLPADMLSGYKQFVGNIIGMVPARRDIDAFTAGIRVRPYGRQEPTINQPSHFSGTVSYFAELNDLTTPKPWDEL
jgi:hypothetical protein